MSTLTIRLPATKHQRQKMAPREWSATKAQFAVVFDDRFEVSR